MKTENSLSRLDLKPLFLYLGLAASLFIFAIDAFNRIPLPLHHLKGNPEILRKNQTHWHALKIGQVLNLGDKIRTNSESTLQMDLAEDLRIQVDPDSEIRGQGPKLYDREKKYSLDLEYGRLMTAFSRHSAQNKILEIHTGIADILTSAGVFVLTKSRSGTCTVGILKGSLSIYALHAKFPTVHLSQGKAEWKPGSTEVKISPLSLQERREMAAAYLLTIRDPNSHQNQRDASQKSGNIFRHAYFIGDFFTSSQGYTESDFIDDEGLRVLDLFYDLFMPGTFGGFYIETSDLDLQKFDRVTFDLRSKEGLPPPKSFRVEFKSGKRIVRSFGFRDISAEWKNYSAPLKVSTPTPISEIVIVFTYDGIGDVKQGGIQLRNINLTAVRPEEKTG